MGYRVEGCTIDDAAGLGRNNASAYWKQPYWRMLWPQDMDREFIIEQVQKRIGPAVLLRDRDHLRQEKAVDEDTGDIIGYARWNLSEALVKSHEGEVLWADRQVPGVDDDLRKELEEEMDASWWEPRSDTGELDVKIEEARERLHAQEKHIELEYLAVRPESQGQGIASALVRRGVEKAKEYGVPVYLLAFDVARGVYLRQGFREVEAVLQDATPFGGNAHYNTYCMVYDEHLK